MSKPQMKKRPPMKKGVLKRLLGILFREYRAQLLAVVVCVAVVAVASTIASLFMNRFLLLMEDALAGGGWESIRAEDRYSLTYFVACSR